ncbi:hypothetical protein OXPF_00170 [Oxobacter pfennigii]|uniref:Uncharacterized protein n=1 Tax=Oxobacter pfennigii TaxID=36849 RepID=A0A0P8WE17_9CLOT|nr:hypothetical protein [Oxobacter pfennigii]KPU46375.1 hypothetical protein OXPF_00170 [Oxobacter pfennigii]
MKKKITISICLLLVLVQVLIITPIYAGNLSEAKNITSSNEYQIRFSGVTDSKELANTPVATGKIFKEDGVTPVANATVQLYAWPSSDELEKLKEGDSFTRTPIGKTVSDKDGSYVLRIDPKADIEKSWSKFGSLDCEIVTLTDTGINSTSFSIMKADKEENKDKTKIIYPIDTAYADKFNGEVYNGIYADITLVPRPPKDSFQSNDMAPAYSESLEEIYPVAQWVNVGNILIGNSGYTEKFTFESGASCTIGVGFSLSGSYGSFSPSGTISRNSTSAVGFPLYSAPTARFMDTQFKFARWVCFPGDGTWYYLVRAHQFAGGAQTSRETTIPTGGIKSSYAAGSSYIKQTNTATTWSNGARLNALIGIDLSSRCGYSSTSKLEFHFNSTGYLYGETDYAPITNGRVWVKSS